MNADHARRRSLSIPFPREAVMSAPMDPYLMGTLILAPYLLTMFAALGLWLRRTQLPGSRPILLALAFLGLVVAEPFVVEHLWRYVLPGHQPLEEFAAFGFAILAAGCGVGLLLYVIFDLQSRELDLTAAEPDAGPSTGTSSHA